jgi:MFS family permease
VTKTTPISPACAIFAGLCASLVAIGLARFAYTPLIPSLIHAQWFAATDVVYLGAANFAGYFLGAVLGRPLADRTSRRFTLRAMMLLASVSFIACAFPLSLLWFFAWRFASGFAGAVVMVLVAQTILPLVAQARHGMASGAIFMGIGAGIVASGTLIPLLLPHGLATTWIGLGIVSAVLTALTWRAWPAHAVAVPAPGAAPAERAPLAVRLLYVEYAAVAIGLVPAAVFLVDFVARGLHEGAAHGARYWIAYGIGALCGPLVYGAIADRIGFRSALRIGLLLSGVASALLAFQQPPGTAVALALASLLLGAFTPGVVSLMIGRLHELLPGDHPAQHAAWSRSTTVFALCQALSGYAYSFLFAQMDQPYHVLYLIAGGAFAVALLTDFLAAR